MAIIALLSDIHANSDALSLVLEECKKQHVKKILIAGDFIGYYYNAVEALDLLSSWDFIAIGGNHEAMLLNWKNNINRKSITKKYGSGIQNAYHSLTKKQINWLVKLPERKELIIDGKHVLICHGSPWDRDEYIYPDTPNITIKKILDYQYDLVVYGHTHYPFMHQKDKKFIVNPGSIGQTRDKKPGACWALWDTKTHHITLKRTIYPINALIEQCKKNDPDMKYLQTALTRNNEN